MNLYLRLGLGVWGIIACLATHAQTFNATWILGPPEDSLNTHIFTRTIILHAEVPTNAQLLWPEIKDSLGGIEILTASEVVQTATENTSNSRTTTFDQTFSLIAWQPGLYQIPSVDIQAVTPQGDTLRTFARSTSLDVQIALADTTSNLEPIKEIQAAPLTLTEILTWGGLGLAVLLVIGGIIYFIMRSRQTAPITMERKVPAIPPHEWAMKALSQLESEKKWQNGDIKGYYVALSDILRGYMEEAFDFPAKESVTEEILTRLDAHQLPSGLASQLRELLVQADFTKYAKSHPDPQTNLNSMDFARKFVKESHAYLQMQQKAQEQENNVPSTLETRA
ncbi:MAG: hypothetical protein AAFQ83_11435 [Bacteroidota bacterium]